MNEYHSFSIEHNNVYYTVYRSIIFIGRFINQKCQITIESKLTCILFKYLTGITICVCGIRYTYTTRRLCVCLCVCVLCACV